MKNFKIAILALALLASFQEGFAAEAPAAVQSAGLTGVPTDIKQMITRLLTNFRKYEDAINAINALYQTNQKFRQIVEVDAQWLLNDVANNFACASKETIANDLKIASLKNLLKSPRDNWLKSAIAQEKEAPRTTLRGSPKAAFLARAIKADNLEEVERLVAQGGNFKKIAAQAIAQRAFEGLITEKTLEIVDFLIQNGISAQCLDWALFEYAPLASNDTSMRNLYLEMVKKLIAGGANVNNKKYGYTVLIQTLQASDERRQSSYETLKYLLENGANPNIKDPKGKTALDIASESGVLKQFADYLLRSFGAKHSSELR